MDATRAEADPRRRGNRKQLRLERRALGRRRDRAHRRPGGRKRRRRRLGIHALQARRLGAAGAEADGEQIREFGWDLELSGDGGTALIGSYGGGAWVLTRSGSSWTQQGGKLAPSDPIVGPADIFGSSVALSDDGDTALIADPFANGRRGAIWSFVRVAGTWAQHGSRTEAGGEVGAGDFGTALDLASDGNSAFVGAPAHDSGVGAVWSFVVRPVVANVTPASGPTTGGTPVTITGSELANAGQVLFGSTPAASFTVVSRSTIRAVSPPHAAGAVDVTVSNSGGTSAVTAATHFTYVTPQATPPPPPRLPASAALAAASSAEDDEPAANDQNPLSVLPRHAAVPADARLRRLGEEPHHPRARLETRPPLLHAPVRDVEGAEAVRRAHAGAGSRRNASATVATRQPFGHATSPPRRAFPPEGRSPAD